MIVEPLVTEGRWQLTEDWEDGKNYLTFWHLHPERDKKRGLVSAGRKCMDCDEVSPSSIGGFDVEADGYVMTDWEKETEYERKTNTL